MRTANWRVLIGLVIVALSLVSMGVAVHAEEQKPPQPEDFWWTEFWGGFVGGFVGGFLGGTVGYLCWGIPECAKLLTGREPSYFLEGALGGLVVMAEMTQVGRAVGAATGVVLTGSALGVDGNVAGAYLATGLWLIGIPIAWLTVQALDQALPSYSQDEGHPSALRFLANIADFFVEPARASIIALYVVPGVPAYFATVGYNIGAKMKSDKTRSAALGWRLSLIDWRF